MSDSEKPPEFVREPEHKFTEKEKIYVIDPNGFDIYEAIIKKINNGSYEIDYPQYPSDNFTTTDTGRFLVINDANKAIYENQETLRLAKDIEEEEEEGDSGEPDDPEDGDATISEEDEGY